MAPFHCAKNEVSPPRIKKRKPNKGSYLWKREIWRRYGLLDAEAFQCEVFSEYTGGRDAYGGRNAE